MLGLALTADHLAGELDRGTECVDPGPGQTMRNLIVKQLGYELTPVAGLSLVGALPAGLAAGAGAA